MNATVAVTPAIPSWFWVPVSARSGEVSGAGSSFGKGSESRSSRRAKRIPMWGP